MVTSFRQSANLDGLFLTGLGKDGCKTLQKYIDCSGDVQTAVLIATQTKFFWYDSTENRRIKWLYKIQISCEELLLDYLISSRLSRRDA